MRLICQAMLGLALLMTPAVTGAQTPSPPRLVLVCAPCHGFDGVGHDRTIPNLAGQPRDYLLGQLTAFRGGQRIHPTMSFFSGQMSREELDGIVEYYSTLAQP
jgi:cytochrome c553